MNVVERAILRRLARRLMLPVQGGSGGEAEPFAQVITGSLFVPGGSSLPGLYTIPNSIAATGWMWSVNRVLVQWGTVSTVNFAAGNNALTAVVFTTAYPTALWYVQQGIHTSSVALGATQSVTGYATAASATGFTPNFVAAAAITATIVTWWVAYGN
jgi:hypothetical protein